MEVNMKICTACGNNIEEELKLCPVCGFKFETAADDENKEDLSAKNTNNDIINKEALKEKINEGIDKVDAFIKEKGINEKLNAGKEKVDDFMEKHNVKEKFNDGKEKVKGGINRLPFKKLAEDKIPDSYRTKFPVLNKVIPFANQIVCGAAILLLIVFISGISGRGQSISGTFSYNNNPRFTITFTRNNFTGTWAGNDISGTFRINGDEMTLNTGSNTWDWTIIDNTSLRDHDGDVWRSGAGATQTSSGAAAGTSTRTQQQVTTRITRAVFQGPNVMRGNHQVYYVVEGNNRERHFEANTQQLATDRPITILIRGDTIIFNGFDGRFDSRPQHSFTYQIQGSSEHFLRLVRISSTNSHRRF